jgi:hypothetical protein
MSVEMIFAGNMFNVFFYFCAYYPTWKGGNEKIILVMKIYQTLFPMAVWQ